MQPMMYLAQFCTCYERTQFLAAMRVLKYQYTAKYKKLTFRGGRTTLDDQAADARHCMYLIRNFVNKGIIILEYISSEHNVAEMMTKPLQKLKHSYFTNMLLQDQEE
mmetsp:Transcript_40408/g.75680  ORF Transcript_40408/g.75680 Transcript_40408/m.75680 type:complete len:107 (-) Transcript_40408:122-442(-)